jgi:hypothetical protein
VSKSTGIFAEYFDRTGLPTRAMSSQSSRSFFLSKLTGTTEKLRFEKFLQSKVFKAFHCLKIGLLNFLKYLPNLKFIKKNIQDAFLLVSAYTFEPIKNYFSIKYQQLA